MKTSRRKFLQTGSLALGASLLPSFATAAKPVIKRIGVQLFTFMGIIDQDPAGTLKKIATLGFKDIESAFSMKGGYYGLKPKEFKAMVEGQGMAWQSHHVLGTPFVPPPDMKLPFDVTKILSLKNNMQQLVDEVAEGGAPYLTCANIAIGSLDEVKQAIEILNNTAALCKKAGLTLTYHNHDAEFKAVEGQIPYTLFLRNFDQEIKMELDLAWVAKAGVDPVKLFQENPKRFPLWHVKDMDAGFTSILPVGAGTIDFTRIFAHAKTAGLKHCFVEHDMPADAFGSIAGSIQHLKTKILTR
jgi:sugar phosphate isomerase/epimerase